MMKELKSKNVRRIRRSSKKPKSWQKVAKERVKILLDLAAKEFKSNPDRSKRYVQLAKKIGMRYNVRIPKDLKRKFCKNCYAYLIPGVTCRVRTRGVQQAVIVTCLKCGNVTRHPYRKEKIAKKLKKI